MPKQYLTVNEVARIMGVSPLTVRNWDQKGRLKAHRNPLNNYRLYKVADVEKLLQEISQSRGKKFLNKIFVLPSATENSEIKISEKIISETPAFKKLKIEME